MDADKLKTIIDLHTKWLRSEEGGSRADLPRANLSGANLSGADLSWAYLPRANLSRANLSGANLSGANLSRADLSRANLSGADLSWANLSGADLSWADLSWADLSRADLSGADHDASFAHGQLLAFDWTTYIHSDGTRWLRYGCEHHALSAWPKKHAALAKAHKPDEAARYANATRSLAAFVKTLPGKPARKRERKK